MKRYTASTTITATADKVWGILTDGPHYTDWDPAMIKLEGTIAPGEMVKATTKLAPNRAFPAKVTVFEPGKKMVWASGMPLGLFKGERTFLLTTKVEGVEFTLTEEFSGLLLPIFGRSIPDMTKTFQEFCAGLKAQAETA